MKKVLILTAVAASLIIPVAVSYLLFQPDSSRQAAAFGENPIPLAENQTSPPKISSRPLVVFESPPAPVKKSEPKTAVSQENLARQTVKGLRDSVRRARGTAARSSSSSFSQPVSPPASPPRPVLSKQEVFDRLYPAEARDYLRTLEKVMRDQKFLKSSDVFNFDDHEHIGDVYDFLKRAVDFGVSVNLVSQDQVFNFKQGVDKARDLNEVEAQELERTGRSSAGFPDGEKTLTRRENLLAQFLETLKDLFVIPVAYASWVSAPTGLCFKFGAINSVPGLQHPAFCCNCGIHFDEGVPIFLPECGPYNFACDIGLGCLNGWARKFPSAVWDGPPGMPPPAPPPPWTGICGFGI